MSCSEIRNEKEETTPELKNTTQATTQMAEYLSVPLSVCEADVVQIVAANRKARLIQVCRRLRAQGLVVNKQAKSL